MTTAARDADHVLEEWEFFRDYFQYTPEQAAARLGMRPDTFERALYRAAERGDPRAHIPHHMKASN